MEKTKINRTLKELYEVALINYREKIEYQYKGLCFLINQLSWDGIINNKECYLLLKSFRRNKPTKWLHKELFKDARFNGQFYWWAPGSVEPRILFLEKMIKYVELPWYIKLWEKLK